MQKLVKFEKDYGNFYRIVDHGIELGRPVFLFGGWGVGKTVLLDNLRPSWITTNPLGKCCYFDAPILETPLNCLSALHRSIHGERALSAKLSSELCEAIELAITKSEVKFLIIDNGHELAPEFYKLLWRCLENLRRHENPIGCVIAMRTGRETPKIAEIGAAIPAFGQYTINRLDDTGILSVLALWLPTATRDFVERLNANEQDALDTIQLILNETKGVMRLIADFAVLWEKRFDGVRLDYALAHGIFLLKDGHSRSRNMQLSLGLW